MKRSSSLIAVPIPPPAEVSPWRSVTFVFAIILGKNENIGGYHYGHIVTRLQYNTNAMDTLRSFLVAKFSTGRNGIPNLTTPGVVLRAWEAIIDHSDAPLCKGYGEKDLFIIVSKLKLLNIVDMDGLIKVYHDASRESVDLPKEWCFLIKTIPEIALESFYAPCPKYIFVMPPRVPIVTNATTATTATTTPPSTQPSSGGEVATSGVTATTVKETTKEIDDLYST
jgi:hypothetical protein